MPSEPFSSMTGATIIASATFVGALVGSVTQFGLSVWESRRRRKNLRLALRSEIYELDIGKVGDFGLQSLNEANGTLQTPVFEGNSGKIGDLTEDEITTIIPFYIGVDLLNSYIRGISDPAQFDELLDELGNEEESLIHLIEGYRQDAINSIDENL